MNIMVKYTMKDIKAHLYLDLMCVLNLQNKLENSKKYMVKNKPDMIKFS